MWSLAASASRAPSPTSSWRRRGTSRRGAPTPCNAWKARARRLRWRHGTAAMQGRTEGRAKQERRASLPLYGATMRGASVRDRDDWRRQRSFLVSANNGCEIASVREGRTIRVQPGHSNSRSNSWYAPERRRTYIRRAHQCVHQTSDAGVPRERRVVRTPKRSTHSQNY